MNKLDIWTLVKLRMVLSDDSLQVLIESYIDEIELRIMHYCGLSEIPDGLKFVWASMAIDAVRVDLPNVGEIADTVGGAESVKIGDTQVSPARSNGGDISNTSKSSIDKIVLNYKFDLNRYRKLRW